MAAAESPAPPPAAPIAPQAHPRLLRQVGLPGAILMGLGSILGTGVFVSLATAAGIGGTPVISACVLAGLLAGCNGLSAAQLAAAHPVSGGTYEYAHRFLTPPVAFSAGWIFLLAKSASAATAALGFAAYLLHACHLNPAYLLRVPLAAAITLLMTALTAAGVKRSNAANALIVGITVSALVAFAAAVLPRAAALPPLRELFPAPAQLPAFLHAAALLFVAYTGYARVATLGEEVHHPRRTIPRAMIITLAITAALYVAVSAAAVFTVGAAPFGQMVSAGGAPLTRVAETLHLPAIAWLVSLGAITAMLGVLLNLLLGLSRVLLAMARRGDMPRAAATLNAARTTPYVAVGAMGFLVTGLTLLGDVKTAWSFSAFMVLIYYALTNIAALRLPREHRFYPRIVPAAGLLGCLALAFWVDAAVWITGLALIGVGLLWWLAARRLSGAPAR